MTSSRKTPELDSKISVNYGRALVNTFLLHTCITTTHILLINLWITERFFNLKRMLSFFSSGETLLLTLQRNVRLSLKVGTIFFATFLFHSTSHILYNRKTFIKFFQQMNTMALAQLCSSWAASPPHFSYRFRHSYRFIGFLRLSLSLQICSYFLNRALRLVACLEKWWQLCFYHER